MARPVARRGKRGGFCWRSIWPPPVSPIRGRLEAFDDVTRAAPFDLSGKVAVVTGGNRRYRPRPSHLALLMQAAAVAILSRRND